MTRIGRPVWILVALVLALGASLAAEQKADPKAAKDKKPAKPAAERKTEPPISEIYRAAHPGAQAQPSSEDSEVITNEDLERMWSGLSPTERLQGVYQAERHIGTPAGDAGAAAGKGEANAGEWLEKRQASEADTRTKTAEAEKKVADLRAKVDELERRLLAVRNPLLPRRYAERKNEEDKSWDQKTNPERVQATEDELKKAKDDLAAAERELAQLRGPKS